MSKTRSVTPLGRLITRAEYLRAQGDFGVQFVKALRRYEEHWTAQLARLEARIASLEGAPTDSEGAE